MRDEPATVTVSMDLPSSLIFQRLRALGRLIGLRITLGGRALGLSLETGASERTPSWSAGDVERPEMRNFRTKKLEVGGLLCPKLFGDPPDLRRYAHVAMVDPVVPWPTRLLLAPLLAMTEEELFELCYKDPATLLARVGEAEAAGRRVNGWSPKELVWWSVPVIAAPLRAASVEESKSFIGEACFSRTLHDAYRRIVNRRNRLRRLKELDAPAVIVENERRMAIEAVDQLLVNRDLENPYVYEDEDEGTRTPMMDATTLFLAALTPLVEIAQTNQGGGGWITKAASLRDARSGTGPRVSALWSLAAEAG
ncbi:hypothetical protein [Polyangium jinanense]|uniref:Uncharacterized protein n=1 Tax=Polyangium jinanense TaxID=2829994 RepID=A0A9X3X5H3_9BACT|nr:hypothetical protein [Polyangium jinanense]MDC3960849.1 hypothetical protein [Polyangium jinanense]MDC3984672.1 hypothetical protein [Polyangium jinanense]